MVSRQETARPLLTPGEIMQLPAADELVLVSGLAPIRAKKARYYADKRLATRVLPPPARRSEREADPRPTDPWSSLAPLAAPPVPLVASAAEQPPANDGKVEAAAEAPADAANAGIRREPELQPHEAIAPETPPSRASREFDDPDDEGDGDQDAVRVRVLQDRAMRGLARQVSMDPADGMEL